MTCHYLTRTRIFCNSLQRFCFIVLFKSFNCTVFHILHRTQVFGPSWTSKMDINLRTAILSSLGFLAVLCLNFGVATEGNKIKAMSVLRLASSSSSSSTIFFPFEDVASFVAFFFFNFCLNVYCGVHGLMKQSQQSLRQPGALHCLCLEPP